MRRLEEGPRVLVLFLDSISSTTLPIQTARASSPFRLTWLRCHGCSWQVAWREDKCFYDIKMLNQGQRLRKRTELTISYGDRSNEEFLFLYGFVLDVNPYDQLRIPLEIWEERQIPPFIILPGRDIVSSIKLKPKQRPSAEQLTAWIPSDVWEVLETLVANSDVRTMGTTIPLLDKVSMLKRVLERHRDRLEGSSGTGTLERDIETLKKPHSNQANIVYRSVQKRLTRQWLEIVTRIEAKFQEMP